MFFGIESQIINRLPLRVSQIADVKVKQSNYPLIGDYFSCCCTASFALDRSSLKESSSQKTSGQKGRFVRCRCHCHHTLAYVYPVAITYSSTSPTANGYPSSQNASDQEGRAVDNCRWRPSFTGIWRARHLYSSPSPKNYSWSTKTPIIWPGGSRPSCSARNNIINRHSMD